MSLDPSQRDGLSPAVAGCSPLHVRERVRSGNIYARNEAIGLHPIWAGLHDKNDCFGPIGHVDRLSRVSCLGHHVPTRARRRKIET